MALSNLSGMTSMRIKQWEKLAWKDPSSLAGKSIAALRSVANTNTPDEVKALRGSTQKWSREMVDAAVFSHGVSQALSLPSLEMTMLEESDYDFVVRWVGKNEVCYAPVQLKDLPPVEYAGSNPRSLNESLQGLAKYATSSDLIVAYKLSRIDPAELREIKVPKLNIASLWLFAEVSPDCGRWILYGDMLKSPQLDHFTISLSQA